MGAALIATPLALLSAQQERTIPVRVEPTATINAFVVISGQTNRSIEVRDGKAIVPGDLGFPWVVASQRFEPLTYTSSDFEQQRSLVLRELGTIKGTIQPMPLTQERTFALLAKPANGENVTDLEVMTADDGGFQVRLAAGIYQIAMVGGRSATKIRSGVVVRPGATTDIGALLREPTVRVTARVIDAKRGQPIQRAVVQWEPPDDALAADVARLLYGKKWSTVTDAQGIATFPSVGPVPIPIRWRVSAKGYAVDHTPLATINERRDLALPDTKMRSEASIIVHTRLPRDADDLKDATIALDEPESPRSSHYVVVARKPLQEGETRFALEAYGHKRIAVESAKGKTLLYRDFNADSEQTILDLPIEASEVSGAVTRKDEPVENATVTLADPADARVILARATTAKDGAYRLKTYQSTGDLFLYTAVYGRDGQGAESGVLTKSIRADGRKQYFVDFELPNAGFSIKVVDASTGAALRASVDKRIELKSGNSSMGVSQTDDQGRLTLAGFSEGTAVLEVSATAHRAREVTVAIEPNARETLIKLDPSGQIDGRVVDEHGAPVQGARVMGGFADEKTIRPYFYTISDSDGHFHIDSAPQLGAVFYVAAPRQALAITTLQSDHLNTITLNPPGTALLSLMPDNAPPTRRYMIMAAPAGGDFIPLGALDALAQVNGMNPIQLHVNGKDGVVVLPEFLAPGTYDLFLAANNTYQRIGSIRVPADRNIVLAYKTK